MTRRIVTALLLLPTLAGAQRVSVRERGEGHAAAIVDSITAGPHVVRSGTGDLVVPRDTTITTSLLVLGRPTFLAGTVKGDVVVVGSDLFLRPGANVQGRAIAIGGTVAETTLGHVTQGTQSLRDETFVIEREATGYALTARSLRVGGATDTPGIFRLAGIKGVRLPSYDRVDGLSLPVGIQLVFPGERVIAPTLTYRSRLGTIDPSVDVRLGAEDGTRFEGRLARDTRSNDTWITSELINSLKTFAFGTDTRNYFRSDIAEGRFFLDRRTESRVLEPYAGARWERVTPITSVGNVYSIIGRTDSLKMRRPNPGVEIGKIGSVLAGAVYRSLPADAPVTSRVSLGLEQSFVTPGTTTNFTQLTADGMVGFPTFGTQRLLFRGHAVGSLGDSVPRARYAYLGGSRTLGLSDLLEFGGDQLVFLDSRYLVPLPVMLPVVGTPTASLIHRMGGAGVRTLGPLQQEVGVGLSLGPPGVGSIDFELLFAASGQKKKSEFGVGVSIAAF